MDLWHHRLGHSSERVIRKMAESGCIPSHRIDLRHRLSFCESCASTNISAKGPISAATREPDSPSLPTRMLEELSIDVAGPYPKDKKGNRYFVLLVDRFTRFKYIGLMKKKSDTFDHFMSFCESASRQNPDVSVDDVVSIRMDGGAQGGEFSSIRDFSAAHGIRVQPTGQGNPNGNALAEISIGKVCYKMRATLHASSLPHSYWSEALHHAVETTNRVPTRALEGSVSPYEKWYGHSPSVCHLRTFGSPCFVYQPLQLRPGKLSPKGLKHKFLSYGSSTGVYRLLSPNNNVIMSK
ncbi:unnamed protein product, partial [Heterosigma akashiwo]